MNSKRWIALITAAVLMLFSVGLNTIFAIFKNDFFESFDSAMSMGTEEMTFFETSIEGDDWDNRIALLNVDGTILDVGSSTYWEEVAYDHQLFLSQLDAILNDDTVKAVVLSVNSPGGGVLESAEIHEKIVQIKEERGIPIYVSMGSMAASGGYYIAAPADKIFAQKETITGSIGVIMQSYNFEKLAEKVGIEFETIKSGAHKDMLGGTRATSEEELAMVQEMINEMYEDFVDIVETGRNMSEADVKKVADGRILGGTQALKAGLVDEIGKLDDTIAAIRADYDLEGAQLFEYSSMNDSWGSLLGMKISSFVGPSAEERYVMDLLSAYNSQRMMYLYGGQ
ncbi:signal peptide peptidase SppA [Lysinibacillus sp. 54212]|uniref:signal peptide peptidase SppA n=1 Tax=Lysinibacillus sp. 54212 TaxID=3119829 RepID=UPI002FCA9437